MSGIRRAFLFTATERYIVISVNFAMMVIVARLLTPEEVGYSVIGAATMAVAEIFRDFGATSFIVQQTVLDRKAARTAATCMLLMSLIAALAIWCSAGTVASFYQKPGLQAYMHVLAVSFLAGPLSGPLMALLRRTLAFGAVATINVASATATAVVTVALALLGAGYMTFAWGSATGATMAAVLAVLMSKDHWVLRPTLAEWRKPLSFGLYSAASGILSRAADFLPALILGRMLTFDAVGLYNRATLVCQLPDKCLLTGLLPVVLPVFAEELRAGRSLKAVYLRGTSYITAVQWPSLLLLIFLAQPVVAILLGRQWASITPLVQIIAATALLGFPGVLAYPTLVAVGALKDTVRSTWVMVPINAALVAITAHFGISAVALSLFVTIPMQSMISIRFVRSHVPFTWDEMAGALQKSLVVAGCSLVAPVLTFVLLGLSFDVPIGLAGLTAAGSIAGWLLGLRATQHPLHAELCHLSNHVRGATWGPLKSRLRDRLWPIRTGQA